MEQQDQRQQTTASTSNNISSSLTGVSSLAGGSGGDVSSVLNSSSDSRRPPALRRVTGGWADSAVGSKLKWVVIISLVLILERILRFIMETFMGLEYNLVNLRLLKSGHLHDGM